MYDLTIIGAGWAGFNASLKAKQSGLKACLIEKAQIGGTCLNQGCIPTKALIQSAKVFSLVKKSAQFGIDPLSPNLNFLKAQERKEKIITQLRNGMQFMLKGVDFLNIEAGIISPEEIKTGSQNINTKSILIACGSKPIELPFLKFDGQKILSSDDILNLKEIPASLLIIGGGVIGCEFASLFSSLGTQVTVVEKLPQLLPGEDSDVAKMMETVFRKNRINVHTNTDASAFDTKDYSLTLVCVGRAPETFGLGLEGLGIKTDRGKIIVDDYLRTNIGNIFAAGDCTGKKMLAHFAAYQGTIAAENIASADNLKKCDNAVIPNCIFTDPEIASVGILENEAGQKGIEINLQKFDFLGSGMARILDETTGFIKIVSDKKTQVILGGAIVGPRATELIAILTQAATARLTVAQVKNIIFAHPTLAESIHETLK